MSACWGVGWGVERNTSELLLLPSAVFITAPFLKFIIHVFSPAVLSKSLHWLVSDGDFVLVDTRSTPAVSHCSHLWLPFSSPSPSIFSCLVISHLPVLLFLSALYLSVTTSSFLPSTTSSITFSLLMETAQEFWYTALEWYSYHPQLYFVSC